MSRPEKKATDGIDPTRWVMRLREVADESQFTEDEKALIEKHLSSLLNDLEDAA